MRSWQILAAATLSLALPACTAAPATGADDLGDHAAGDLATAPNDLAGGAPADLGGVTDGGAPDVSAPAIACADAVSDVYVTPANLPPMTNSTRGDIVRCAVDSDLDLATVQNQVAAKGIAATMLSSVHLYRIAFRTVRGDGSAGVSTARVYLPSLPAARPVPLVVIGHPTDGLAPSCAPSTDPTSNQDLALPWAGGGDAVIVPDYAGLGNEGVQSYLDNRDQAHAILDGARALRKLLPAGATATDVLAVGYSQGGGAVLSAQAIARDYGLDGTLAGVIAFAPEWPTRLNSFGYVDELNNPTELTIATGISDNVVTVMRSYAYFYNRVGASDAGDAFPASARSGIDGAATTLCQTPLGGYLQGTATHVGDLFDPTFRTALLDCIANGDTDAGCVDPAKSWYDYLVANFVTNDAAGAPILYLQGLADPIMPPAREAACNLAKLQADGVTPQVCVDGPADHQTLVGRNMDFALSWAQALSGGTALPSCSAAGMPACTP